MHLTELSEIINKNWFQEISKDKQRIWTFYEDLGNSEPKTLKNLIELYNNYKDNAEISPSLSFNVAQDDVKVTLTKFLHCITLSEYRFDSLLYSRATRDKALAQYAKEIGLPLDEVINIYQWWHSGARNTVYSQ